jgi:hypothetical protein
MRLLFVFSQATFQVIGQQLVHGQSPPCGPRPASAGGLQEAAGQPRLRGGLHPQGRNEVEDPDVKRPGCKPARRD